MDPSAGETGGGQGGFGGGSNQLSHLVPTYNPASDDLLIYSQKVELLAQAWPSERRPELVARLMLGCSGSAFHKLQLHRDDLMKGDKDAVQRLITLLGGYWGKVPLEKRYELTERALFRCQQKGDETHDSYLARADIAWAEMLARKTSLAELQAYIILRGSQLSSEDKKRVILESDASGDGELTMDRVSKAVRMLGAGFFQEMVTGKKQVRSKTYDYSTAFVTEEPEEDEPDTLVTWADDQEDEAFELLLSEGDEDAALIADYEAAVTDLVQGDPELAATYNAYAEARKRLNDKFKHRGFWPVRSSSKGKGGKSKGKGKDKGARKSLQSRILSSNCRICGQRGHWKAECPLRSQGSTNPPGPSPGASFTGLAEAYTTTSMSKLPAEFLEIPEVPEVPDDVPCPEFSEHFAFVLFDTSQREKTRYLGETSTPGESEWMTCSAVGDTGHTPGDRAMLRKWLRPRPFQRSADRVSERARNRDKSEESVPCATALSVDTGGGACGIVDSGATKTVIGSELIGSFLEALEPKHRASLGRCPCQVTFRFGNQGTLESHQALVVSLGGLRLKIAIVPGRTPFLLSNTLLRTLHACLNTHEQHISSPFMKLPVKLRLTSRGLFVLDMNELMTKMTVHEHGILPSTTFVAEAQEKPARDIDRLARSGVGGSIATHETRAPDSGFKTPERRDDHVRCARALEGASHGGQSAAGAPEPRGDGEDDGGLWQGASRKDLPTDLVRGAEVAGVVPEHLRGLLATRPPAAGARCTTEVHRAGRGRQLRPRSPPEEPCDHERDQGEESQGGGQELRDQGGSLGDAGRRLEPGGNSGPAADALQRPLGPPPVAGDHDGDEALDACMLTPSWPSHDSATLTTLVRRYEAELRNSIRTHCREGPQAHLFEVFCGPESQSRIRVPARD